MLQYIGDIFVDNGQTNGRVDKWIVNTNTSIPVMNVGSSCYGLFVDVTDALYCSMYLNHQVVKRWLNDNSTTTTVVAGTGIAGGRSASEVYLDLVESLLILILIYM